MKFKIEKLNCRNFIVKAIEVKNKKGDYHLFYKEDKFLRKWKFMGFADNIQTIEQTIYDHLGFTGVIHRIS